MGDLRIVIALGFALLLGCGADRETLAPVTGTVTYQGQPLARGTILFAPQKGRSAQGRIENGQILDVSTYAPDDGAVVGTHAVAIFAHEREMKDMQDMYKPVLWTIPPRYGDPKTSGLSVEISADEPTPLRLELTD